MVGRLVVSLTQRKVRLIRNGRVFRTYPIAIGQPAYPTPTGEYEINDKQKDPVWTAGLPVGGGALVDPAGGGTRWAPAGSGPPRRRSACTARTRTTRWGRPQPRLHADAHPDVEALYELVTIGMKISIRP